jgi:hypothetical protein
VFKYNNGEIMRIDGNGLGVKTLPSVGNDITINGNAKSLTGSWINFDLSTIRASNPRPIKDALVRVRQLNGLYYDRLDLGRQEMGLDARAVDGVVSEVVSHDKAGQVDGITYGPLVALLIEAIKEQDKTIQDQKALNQQLLDRLAALEKQVEQLRGAK